MEDVMPKILKVAENLILKIRSNKNYSENFKELRDIKFSELIDNLNSDDRRKAFWINIYNSQVRKKVIEKEMQKYPKSEFFEEKEIRVSNLNLSLDDIEHKILRRSKIKISRGYLNRCFVPSWEKRLRVDNLDFRIHFALNCGAKSCPPVAFYDASKIESQLDLATRNFLQNDSEWDQSKNELKISKIFYWYTKDFGGKDGVLKIHRDYGVLPKEANNKVKMEYKNYDWKIE